MWVALHFLASALVFGASAAFRFPAKKDAVDFAALAIVLGLSVSAFLAFLVSFAQSSLTLPGILLASAMLATAALLIFPKGRKAREARHVDTPVVGWSLGVGALLFLVLSFFAFQAFSVDEAGNISSIQNAWGDYPLHLAIINSFALRNNFPPVYPNLEGAVMRYPFLFDFLSSVLAKGGLSLQAAVLIPGVLAFFALVFLGRMLARRLLGKRELAVSAALLFFFLNGNFAFLYKLPERLDAGSIGSWLGHLPEVARAPEHGIEFLNLAYSVFIPQRTMLLGFALSLVVYYLLARILSKENGKTDFVFLAGILALLPLVHIASFAVAGAATGIVFLLCFPRKRQEWKTWLSFIALTGLLVLPQLAWIDQQPRMPDFFGAEIGWISHADNVLAWAWFWVENVGLVLPLAVAGWFFAGKELKRMFLPFALIFLAANLVRFQPWDWDNVKYFSHWLFFASLLAGMGIAACFDWLAKRLRGSRIPSAVVAVLLLAGTVSGALTLVYWSQTSHVLFTAADSRFASMIAENTPQNAVFLTAPRHNHFAYALAGRQVVMGYEGHLWSHGLNYQAQRQLVDRVFTQGKVELAFSADYVVVSPFEHEMDPTLLAKFTSSPAFKEVLGVEDGGQTYAVFKALPA